MVEQRSYRRLKERDRVTVRVLSAPRNPDLENRTFFCDTEDISPRGARFCVDTRFPVGAMLELRVALQHPLQAFRHVGRVAWLEAVEEGTPYLVGVEFAEAQTDKLIAWKDIVNRKLSAEGASERTE